MTSDGEPAETVELTDDIWRSILSALAIKDIIHSAQACRGFRRLISEVTIHLSALHEQPGYPRRAHTDSALGACHSPGHVLAAAVPEAA